MIGTRREHPHGTVTNVFRFECTSLVMMKLSHDEEQPLTVLQVGEFVINLYVRAVTHITMTTCSVHDLQWPISRDSMVIRAGERSFAFVMLGLLYGLQLPPVCDEDTVNTLERVFMKFGDYTGLDNGENGYPCLDHEPSFWATVRPVIENIAREKLGNNWRLMQGNEATSLTKVVRTSAATKIVTNAILTGFLKPEHIRIFVEKREDQNKRHKDSEETCSSSITAITDIVNSFGTVQELTVGDPGVPEDARENDGPGVPEDAREDDGMGTTSQIKFWKLNHLGIALFVSQKSKFLCEAILR